MTDQQAIDEINRATAGVRDCFNFDAFLVGCLIALASPKDRARAVAAVRREAASIKHAVKETK